MIRWTMAFCAILAATPVAAQITDRAPPASPAGMKAPRVYGPANVPPPRTRRIVLRTPGSAVWTNRQDVDRQIRDGRETGQLSRREARGFRRDNDVISSLADRYASDGTLSDSERRELDMRSAVLRDQVNNRRIQGAGRK